MTEEQEFKERQVRQQQNDELVLQELSRITMQDPEHLSVEDKAFLLARFSYLTNEQKKTFKKVLAEKEKELETQEEV